MSAPISRGSAGLLSVGAVAILLLGAFTRSDPAAMPPALLAENPADVAVEAAGEPELPTGLSLGLAEIFRLAQAHVDENVILAFIRNSGQTYSPTADQILYLSDLGLSQNVIAALFKQKTPASPEAISSVAAATDATGAPTPVAFPELPSLNTPLAGQGANKGPFYDALAPYGTWTQVPNYGRVWQPAAETLNPDWRPYVDQGQWVSTDNGLYWQSGYSWGAIAFHYGRWSKDNRLGWVWVPDKVWGPAWVGWRIALSYSGWAPLPPGVGLATARGLTLNNVLPASWFTFVTENNFLSRNLPSYALPASQAALIYGRSLAINNYSIPSRKSLNLGAVLTGTIASTGTETEPLSYKLASARSLDLVAGPQLAPENDTEPLLAMVSHQEAIRALPSLPSQPPPPLKTHHHRWMENSPARWSFASEPRSEPPINRDSPDHRQGVEAWPGVSPGGPARMMAAFAPSSSKSGK
jgi:hypothetical protein